MSDLEKILKLCVDPTLLDSEAEKEIPQAPKTSETESQKGEPDRPPSGQKKPRPRRGKRRGFPPPMGFLGL